MTARTLSMSWADPWIGIIVPSRTALGSLVVRKSTGPD
jgi:hypothetical protein